MIRKVIVANFKKFERLEFDLSDRVVIAGPNNSGKTSLLQAIATWAELGEIWLKGNADLARDEDGEFHRVELELAGFQTLALPSFEGMWWNQATQVPISIQAETDQWKVGFDLRYIDPTVVSVGPMREVKEDDLEVYAKTPPRALYIPSLSGLDVNEPAYGEGVVVSRLAHGKGGTVIRNMLQVVSKDGEKWKKLQGAVQSFFGYELSQPSGTDPISVGYRHSPEQHWCGLLNGAAGFLQTVLLQSAWSAPDSSETVLSESRCLR